MCSSIAIRQRARTSIQGGGDPSTSRGAGTDPVGRIAAAVSACVLLRGVLQTLEGLAVSLEHTHCPLLQVGVTLPTSYFGLIYDTLSLVQTSFDQTFWFLNKLNPHFAQNETSPLSTGCSSLHPTGCLLHMQRGCLPRHAVAARGDSRSRGPCLICPLHEQDTTGKGCL